MKNRAILIAVFFFLLLPRMSSGEDALISRPVLRIETGGHMARIFKMDTDRRNRFLVTGGEDKTVRLWELPSGKALRVLRPPIGPGNSGVIRAVAMSPDGGTIACGGVTRGSDGYNIYIFNRESGRMVNVIAGLKEPVLHLSFSKNGRFLTACQTGNAGIEVFKVPEFTAAAVSKGGYKGMSTGADFDWSGRLVTVAFDGLVRLYDSSFTIIGKAPLSGGRMPSSVKFSPDGSKIAVSFHDSPHIDILSANSLTPVMSRSLPGEMVLSIAWSTDGRYLYASNGGRKGPFVLTRFGDAGKGQMEEVAVQRGSNRSTRSTTTAFLPLSNGSLVFANMESILGVVTADGRTLLYRDPAALWFAGDDSLLVSADGTEVQLNVLGNGRSTIRFSLPDRRLDEMRGNGYKNMELFKADPGIPAIRITDWRSSESPKLNGRPIKLRRGEYSVARAVAAKGKCFALGTNFAVYLFGPDGSEIWKQPFPGIRSVSIPPEGRTVIAASSDGTIRWHSIDDGRVLLTLFPSVDMKRWVVWTASGYYDAAPGAEDLVGWHINRNGALAADFFPVSRFRSIYYRPDVVAKTLELGDEMKALTAADRESGRAGPDIVLEKVLPPVVSIAHPPDGAEVQETEINVRFTVRSPSGEPITGIRVLVDGRPARRIRGVAAQGEEMRSISVTIPEKDSEISVLAANRNSVSEPSTVRIRWSGPTGGTKDGPSPPAQYEKAQEDMMQKAGGSPGSASRSTAATKPDDFVIKPKLYILAIGVSNYRDKDLKLGFAAKDAEDFAGIMSRQRGELYRDIVVRSLIDEKATKDEILDGLDWITKETTSKDVAMVFLAGHGINDPNGIYYFLPVNTDLDRLKRTGLAFSDIKNTVISLAGKTVLFVDTCHSGNIMGSRRAVADINALVNELASAENGAVVFSSSSGRQFSVEDTSWGNGAFTKALVEGIGGKADFLGKGRITINMLDLYLSERVKELTRGRQTPTTAKPTTVADFPIAILQNR